MHLATWITPTVETLLFLPFFSFDSAAAALPFYAISSFGANIQEQPTRLVGSVGVGIELSALPGSRLPVST